MTNEIVVDDAWMTKLFVLLPMSISCFVVREILNEFLETDEVFPSGSKS